MSRGDATTKPKRSEVGGAKAGEFEAIEEAGNAPSVPVDTLAVQEMKSSFPASESDLNSRAARRMRMWAIPIAGIACAAYLIGLACFLARFFAMELPIVAALVAGEKMDWHVWFILALAMVILAAVPLTLAHAIVRMISSEKSDSDDGAKVVTPQLELAKVLSGLLASVLKR